METAITHWPAPAKINLFLHVTGRREDGYHELQTAFQFITLADSLSVEITDDASISRRKATPGVPEEDDLIIRAAKTLQDLTGCKSGCVLALDKKIPMGAGLGGGSSDAATTLLALNYLWNTGLTKTELADIGNQLGADIPVFIHGRAAWAEGTGDQLTAMDLPETDFLLVVPPIHVETAKIFKHQRLTRDTPAKRIRGFHSDWCPDALSGEFHNDLEAVVREEYPLVNEVIERLQAWGQPRMTGSGSGVFMQLDDRAVADQVRQTMPDDWNSYVVRGFNQHPMSDL